jgi:hypothetical protein
VPIDITRLCRAQPFQPAGHHGVGPVHLFGGEDYDGAVTAALSHYLPGGRADMSPVPAETLYVVLTGTLTLDTEGDDYDLHPLDAVRRRGWAGSPACSRAGSFGSRRLGASRP